MPHLDGLSATKILRSKGYTSPIIAFTAHAMVEDKELLLAQGCTDHISKPIDFRLLAKTIIQWAAH